MKYKNTLDIIGRYIILVILAMGNLSVFYIVFTPLTLYSASFILKLLYSNSFLIPGTSQISISGSYIELIPACIAGAAYYFLFVLNLTTPLGFKKRISSLGFLVASFFVLNIIRIVVFAALYASGYAYFDFTHRFVWYVGSTIFVVALWFVNAWLFKIKSVPVYSDIKAIIKDIR